MSRYSLNRREQRGQPAFFFAPGVVTTHSRPHRLRGFVLVALAIVMYGSLAIGVARLLAWLLWGGV